MSPNYRVEMRSDVKTPMRDGINLSADIYLPEAGGPFPTIYERTAFAKRTVRYIEKGRHMATLGYAYVIQNFRGRYDSEGKNVPFHGQGEDGYDTQEWIGRQPWCNGKIGTAGGSYMGMVQWYSAPHCSEFLTCMVPQVAAQDHVADALAPGGAFQLTWLMRVAAMEGILNGRTQKNRPHLNWTEAYRTLPLVEFDELMGEDLPFWKDWIQRPLDDDYWTALNVESKWADIAAPAFIMSGWYDVHAASAFTYFNGIRQYGRTPAARQSRLIIGPWYHDLSSSTKTGDIDFGVHSMVGLGGMEVRWFDHWLKGIDNGIVDEPPVRLFIMGINEWRDEHEWPLARTEWQKWYLHSEGSANTVRGDGFLWPEPQTAEPADYFVYDPDYPAQTLGGNALGSEGAVLNGPQDQRPVEMRSDVLCFSTGPLDADLEVTGPIKLVLYAATDGLDTDWTAKLVDVSPTGYAKNLCDGIIRARYRQGFSRPALLEPNQVYEYEIEVGMTGNVFRAGHRIRLEVSSSNFPRFDRNPNTGHPIGKDAELRPAQQTVCHSRQYPSHLVLPVIPEA